MAKTGRILEVLFFAISGLFAAFAVASMALILVGAASHVGDSVPFDGIALDAVFSTLSFCLFAAIFSMAALVFGDVSHEESPFSLKQAKRIRIIAWLLFAYTLLDALVPRGVVIGGGSNPDGMSVVRFSSGYTNVNVGMFAVSVIFYFLASVFKYGVTLQELSDDTV